MHNWCIRHRLDSIAEVFRPKANGLNFLRLCLALGVILWHSIPLTGNTIEFDPARQLMGNLSVDGFFAISGYLIVSSWKRKPQIGTYLWARILRIIPALWVCLIGTAVVLAPLGIWLNGQGISHGFAASMVMYPVQNAGLRPFGGQMLLGTPTGVPFPGEWNGSLWTLQWEFLCYLGVLGVGLLGLLRRRWTIACIFATSLLGVILTSYGPINNYDFHAGSRFALMFSAGAVIHRYQDTIPVSRWLIASAGLIVIIASSLPDYRLVAALPLAYLLLAGGALIQSPRLRFKNDISYGSYIYGFPVQQVLASAGLWKAGAPLFAAAAIAVTLPLAVASWFLIEKPALALKTRRGPAPRAPAKS